MRIKIGDRVRFLNEVGGGRVKQLLDRQNVEVQTKDGWIIPYLISELIIIPDDQSQEPSKAESNPPSLKQSRSVDSTSSQPDQPLQVVLLAIQEKDKFNSIQGFKWYLVNDSDYVVRFAFYQIDDKGSAMVEMDELEAGTKMIVYEVSLAELSTVKGFQVQGILTSSEAFGIPPLISKFIPFSTKKFTSTGAYIENDFLHEPAIVFDTLLKEQVFKETFPEELDKKLVEHDPSQKFKSGKLNMPTKEVDLHINQLVDSVIGLSNREIIRIQMERFENELNDAIKSRALAIIFIHGIGNGTLKETLRKSIVSDYPICSFEDASFKEYGFGATLVRIRQNR